MRCYLGSRAGPVLGCHLPEVLTTLAVINPATDGRYEYVGTPTCATTTYPVTATTTRISHLRGRMHRATRADLRSLAHERTRSPEPAR